MAWGLERFISSITDNNVLPANKVNFKNNFPPKIPDGISLLLCFFGVVPQVFGGVTNQTVP